MYKFSVENIGHHRNKPRESKVAGSVGLYMSFLGLVAPRFNMWKEVDI